MFAGKPIIGILGGIGSGKSHVARLLGELGCLIVNSDEQVAAAYTEPQVKEALRSWWGEGVFKPGGEVDRRAIAARVFGRTEELRRLEQLLHPIVNQRREQLMSQHAGNVQVPAFVWDTPLLAETGLHEQCDALVFVDAPDAVRLERVRASRGWSQDELARREKLQMPLAEKRRLSDYVISNAAGEAAGADNAPSTELRSQVREVLSRILAGSSDKP